MTKHWRINAFKDQDLLRIISLDAHTNSFVKAWDTYGQTFELDCLEMGMGQAQHLYKALEAVFDKKRRFLRSDDHEPVLGWAADDD